ncbi:type I-E CRISPR-associated protein Cse1/CasA [Streptomyces cucumeris]|uniref:type I-E CRISPR-associated protein Cse1/CasA n=1 Tax=Streptomyces cucumeris TaxID=2962890 RepID=UPI003EB8D292
MCNLLDDLWLSAHGTADAQGREGPHRSGGFEDVGVRRLLVDADRFRDIVVDLPTQKPAIFRQLLLPIVVEALGRPADATEWIAMFRAGAFSPEQRSKLDAYLDEHRHLFNLFDSDAPFAQVAGLHTARNETRSSALLVATAATGNNVPLFSSRSEGNPPELTPGQAARWLLHTHCWDTAGIKTGVVDDLQVKAGKTTGNPVGPLGQMGVVMPVGRTVYETLLLNIPFGQPLLSTDVPQWRRRAREGKIEETLSCATPAWQVRASQGLLDIWTWQSRRIRLVPEETEHGVRVTQVVVSAGDRLDVIPDHEPHTAWVVDSAKTRKKKTGTTAPAPARPRRHQPGRAAWRGLDALLTVDRAGEQRDATVDEAGFHTTALLSRLSEVRGQIPVAYPLQLELTGIAYGTQSSVIEDVFYDDLPLPVAALDPDSIVCGSLLEAVDQAEKLAGAVNNLSADLRRAAGTEPIPWDRGQRPGVTLLHALDPLVRRLLVGLRAVGEDFDQSEEGLTAWERMAGRETWKVAEQVLSSAAPGVFTGRTITNDGKDRIHRLSLAELGFRRRMDEVLTRRAAQRRSA